MDRTRLISAFVFLILLSGCGTDSPTVVDVPDERLIPLWDEVAYHASETLPTYLQDVVRDLDGEQMLALSDSITLSSGSDVVLLANDVVFQLDTRSSRLTAHDVTRPESATVLAEQGDGPGELSFPVDLSMAGDSLYVAQNRRIAVFHCEQSTQCTYVRTYYDERQIYDIAVSPLGQRRAIIRTEEGGRIVPWDSGAQGETALEMPYPVAPKDWMLMDALLEFSSVTISDGGTVAFMYGQVPMLYVEDALRAVKLNPLVTRAQEYNTQTGGISVFGSDVDLYHIIDCDLESTICIKQESMRNRRVENQRTFRDRTWSYFFVDTKDWSVSKTGELDVNVLAFEEDRTLWMTETGVVMLHSR